MAKFLYEKNQIAERLRKRRIDLRRSQAEVAQGSGLAQGMISLIEGGVRSVRAEELPGLAWTLNCSLQWILTGVSPRRRSGQKHSPKSPTPAS